MRSLLAVLLLTASQAFAGETWFVGTLASYHYNTDKKYNQQNWGVGIEQGLTEHFRIVAGGYRNSNRRDSMYFGAAWAPIQIYGPVRLGVAAMYVGGYETSKDTEVLKGAFPFLTVEFKDWGINVPVIPPISSSSPGLIALQVKYRF